jgi:hypothetical protein
MVARASDLRTRGLLRRHVRNRAPDKACLRAARRQRPGDVALRRGFGHFRQAEIRQLGVTALADQDVGRLDVPMQNVRRVRRGPGRRRLP